MPKNNISNSNLLIFNWGKGRVADIVHTFKRKKKDKRKHPHCPGIFVGWSGVSDQCSLYGLLRFGKWHTVIMMDFSFEKLGTAVKNGSGDPDQPPHSSSQPGGPW